MTVPAGKPVSLLSTRFEPLLLRHPANPILTSKDWPYPINSVFNAGATLLADGTTLLLCRVEDRRGLSHLCAARSRNGVDGWQIDSEPTLMPDPKNYPEEIWGIEDPRITFVPELQQYVVTYTSYSRGGPGVSLGPDQRLPHLRTIRRDHAAGRQRLRASASENRRMLGADSSSHDDAWIAHVDFLLSRPALLGQAPAHAGSAPRRLVGCQQDWVVAATHRDFQRMARVLPRSTAHAFGLSVSTGPGPVRSGESGEVPAARRFVDLWAGGGVRAPRRRGRCRVPLRIHDGRRWRHAQHLLRSCGLRDCPGSGQRALSA